MVRVECPNCRHCYEDWIRPSVNLDLEARRADHARVAAYLRECSSTRCPVCEHVVEFETLVIQGDNWSLGTP